MKKYIRDIEKARELERKIELQLKKSAPGRLDRREGETEEAWRNRLIADGCHPDSLYADGADRGL